MKSYFQLQFKILNRKIIDFGSPLFIAYTILPILFIIASNYVFEKTEFGSYVLVLIALSTTAKLSELKRNEFLKSVFSNKDYRILRVIENNILCVPFTLFLLYKEEFLFSILLIFITSSLTLFNFNLKANFTIPTPFNKKPFEFTVGFRKTFLIYPLSYFLTYISVSVGNFNLGIGAILLIGITCISYHTKLENEYFIWNYNLTSKQFLKEKLTRCIINFSILSVPIIITLSIYFYNKIDILFLFFLICIPYQSAIILCKYAAFPNEITLSESIFTAISFMFPPMLIIVIPFFYLKAIKKLNTVLI
jgi:hypothetical protein